MLASELGRELGWDPSTMSKRLTIYLDESGRSRNTSPYLDDLTIKHIREANDLKEAGEAKTFRVAVQKIVGSYTEPVPPESVKQIERRLDAIEQSQAGLHGKLNEMLTAVQQISLDSGPELSSRLTELLTYLRQLTPSAQETDGLS
ncbi:hypothetical protein ACFP9V_03980 [Deinococcus radiopugnans]|uniref:DNA-binding transcriptional MerR regulator n=1 Tax=Deinococcus radiopugnans ATCC 19172 TaxID=585398 RepID=A0A5C4Y6N9_9DEIO|nr:hypothetical protein [Deinococcus radiopugnans]MBB6016919.1 DNA-binding transcriptional MerR regulator [Deinococcus radiopugnans ATCC 19172]TNM71472.1 hypothetical protein FHR04_07945 [Deinococcus radiopugnans ATCC 19172]